MGQEKKDKGFRRNQQGLYASFVVYNPASKKNQRFSIAPTDDLDLALKEKKAILVKLGIARNRAEKRFKFLNRFNSQERLFDAYVLWRRQTAKRSFEEDLSRLRVHIFPYFLGELNLNHPSQWFNYWREFQQHLTKKKLATNTKNNCIKSANSFISFVEESEMGEPIKRLPEFRFETIGRRGVSAVYSEQEIKAAVQALAQVNETYAQIFTVLSQTGLRVSEVLGLEMADVVLGHFPKDLEWLVGPFKEDIPVYGYILLKHQIADPNKITFTKAPLKGRKEILPENNRIVPLIGRESAEILHSLQERGVTGRIFSVLYRELKKAFDQVKRELKITKDLHSLRHTFATNFVRLCKGDPRIVEKVLGHSDPKITQVYNHLAQEIEAKARSAERTAGLQPVRFTK